MRSSRVGFSPNVAPMGYRTTGTALTVLELRISQRRSSAAWSPPLENEALVL